MSTQFEGSNRATIRRAESFAKRYMDLLLIMDREMEVIVVWVADSTY